MLEKRGGNAFHCAQKLLFMHYIYTQSFPPPQNARLFTKDSQAVLKSNPNQTQTLFASTRWGHHVPSDCGLGQTEAPVCARKGLRRLELAGSKEWSDYLRSYERAFLTAAQIIKQEGNCQHPCWCLRYYKDNSNWQRIMTILIRKGSIKDNFVGAVAMICGSSSSAIGRVWSCLFPSSHKLCLPGKFLPLPVCSPLSPTTPNVLMVQQGYSDPIQTSQAVPPENAPRHHFFESGFIALPYSESFHLSLTIM